MAAAKGKTNWFAVGISAVVVVALVGLGLGVWALNNAATAPGQAPESSAVIDAETGAISFGTGEEEIDTYIDFMCPICGNMEDQFGAQLQEAAASDQITLKIHPISILDRASGGTEYSSRAAGSMYCVADSAPDAALDYFNLLFANQPQEGTQGLTNEQLVAFAQQAGAPDAADCITNGDYEKYTRDQVVANNVSGTPTVEINGERVENWQSSLMEYFSGANTAG